VKEHSCFWFPCLGAAIVAIWAAASGGLYAQKAKVPSTVKSPAAPAVVPPVRTVAFSPDGKRLAAGTGVRETPGDVIVWDLADRKVLWRARFPGGARSVAFAPDGKTLAVAFSRPEVRLLDAGSGKLRKELEGHDEAVYVVAFSPDGNTLATAGADRIIRLWDPKAGLERATRVGHEDAIFSLAFSPDGKSLLSASGDRTARLWDLTSRKEEQAFTPKGSIARSVAFSPDGRWFAVGDWGAWVTIRERTSGKVRVEIISMGDSIAYSPDGREMAVCSLDAKAFKIYTIDLRDPNPQESEQIRKSIAALDDASYAVREEATVRLKKLGLVAGPEVEKATESPSAEVRIRARTILTEIQAPQPAGVFKGHTGAVLAVMFSPDGATIASGSSDGTVKLWDVTTRQSIVTLVP
jgi:WD40 repeat protein